MVNFGPLTCSIVTTTRKFFTILGSVLLFGNAMSTLQWTGTILVFLGESRLPRLQIFNLIVKLMTQLLSNLTEALRCFHCFNTSFLVVSLQVLDSTQNLEKAPRRRHIKSRRSWKVETEKPCTSNGDATVARVLFSGDILHRQTCL